MRRTIFTTVNVADAAALIASAMRHPGERWADLGAGTGTFTLALASLLGPAGTVLAVERDASALASLEALARRRTAGVATISPMHADFSRPLALPALDGILLANALHFVRDADQSRVLGDVARHLRPDGRLVLVEYEGRGPSRWVPFPVSFARFGVLARDAGLGDPVRAGARRSAFGGTMYAAVAERVGP